MFFSFKPIIAINLPQENNRQIRNPGGIHYKQNQGSKLVHFLATILPHPQKLIFKVFDAPILKAARVQNEDILNPNTRE